MKRFYEVYKDEGIGAMLEKLREWIGIDECEWRDIVRKLVLVYNIKSVYLEYKYGLRRIPRNVIVREINDNHAVRDLSEYIPNAV